MPDITKGTLLVLAHSMILELVQLRDERPMNVETNNLKPIERYCVPQETEINNVQLAQAYVPFQNMCETFAPLDALIKGTIFPALFNVYGWERKGREDDMCG